MCCDFQSILPPSLSARPRRAAVQTRAAFTLIQVMMSLAIGSMVMTFAVPKVKQAEMHSRATIIAADLRTFATAFETYAQEKGNWPTEVEAGITPPEMTDRLNNTAWARITPIGGQYNWDSNQMHGGVRYRAAICVSETDIAPLPINEEMLTEIDKLMDDGNLNTGNVRIGVNYDLLFIVAP